MYVPSTPGLEVTKVVTSAWQNILGDYTNILKDSELAGTTVLRKLTPAMSIHSRSSSVHRNPTN